MNQVERKVTAMNLEQDNKTEDDKKENELAEEITQANDKHDDTQPEEVVSAEEKGGDVIIEKEAVQTEEESKSEETSEDVVSSESEEADADLDVEANKFYSDLTKKAKEFAESADWSYASNEFANLALHLEDAPAPGSEENKNLLKEFESIRSAFELRKKEHYEELNKKREENLVKKKALLKEFTDIINEEKWSATKDVAQISHKWEHIKQLPHGEVEALNERFSALVTEFESHKVDRLVKKLQKEEENLTLKLVLQDKMDAINARSGVEGVDFESLNKEFDDLITQWRKVGRVPVEKNDLVWDRFNKAQDDFSDLRFKNDKQYRKVIEKALEHKKKLVAEAEVLLDQEDIAEAARRVNKLHKAWKKTKNLPQKDENELWDKFKAATDAFNEKKADNIDMLRDQEQENLDEKLKLIEKAESIQHTEDYEAGHKVMQLLMDDWKKIGPVPRKKSSKIWKSFKAAMDVFYEERRDHFKDIRKDQKDNLSAKKEIIDKLAELGKHEDPAKAVEEAKVLQEDFKKIGHVPLKSKNKVWKQYREVCDTIYERFRSLGADLGMERRLASQGVEPENRKQVIKLEKEQNSIKKEISRLEAEAIQYEEAQTYFKPTKKGNKLLDELQGKIEKAREELVEKRKRLTAIEIEIEGFTESDE